MTGEKKQIVFITQSLGNTGSEILLFHFINFLAQSHSVSVICFTKGAFITALDKRVELSIINYPSGPGVLKKVRRRFNLRFTIPGLFEKYKNHIWYINTIVLPLPVEFAVKNKIPFILHVHELNQMYGLLSDLQLRNALNQPRMLIANSEITKKHLLMAGAGKKIEVLRPFIDLKKVTSYKSLKNTVWAMAGSIDKNKNPALFLEIARASKARDLSHEFVWFYNSVNDNELFERVRSEVYKQSLPVDFVHTNGYDDYLDNFSKCTGLILTSTFESFSLVTLEAMALQMLLVLNDCGGVNEVVTSELASILPLNSSPEKYLDAMQKEMERLELTASGKTKQAEKFDKETTLKIWRDLISDELI